MESEPFGALHRSRSHRTNPFSPSNDPLGRRFTQIGGSSLSSVPVLRAVLVLIQCHVGVIGPAKLAGLQRSNGCEPILLQRRQCLWNRPEPDAPLRTTKRTGGSNPLRSSNEALRTLGHHNKRGN